MSLTSGIAIYLIIWWLVIFMVLPFGAKTKIDANNIEEGMDAGAPKKANMLKKVLATTVISLVIFGLFYAAFSTGMIDFRPPEES